ncbi:ribonuclease R [Aquifex aeolicus]|uniref:Ribonuclease R n=1 Tax=Aquifex aeolicus (strain VF5) TaxID=224324 RepID=RNR_AQUAE|nr:ribonuclease R [Aquifex aeolicus]O67834.1 RecName: Full=Ribonuclease R; Short=RNase R; AltName: Full=VacB protein homolog [Aquifex aeolicus VF5]AAC07792.1 VacB protein (ribonuclease II family) [Aquifex aeolicus VF5]
MDKEKLEKEVIKLLSKKKKPLHFLQIAKALGLGKKERKTLKKVMRKLKKEGKVKVVKGKYEYTGEEVVTGTVIAYPGGFGFLEVEGGKDIYIPPFEMVKVFHGDVVKAKVTEFKGKKEVRIIKVLKRAKKDIVAKVVFEDEQCYVVPLDENAHHRILLSKKDCQKLKEGEVVVLKITQFPTKKSPARGKVIEVLGNPKEKFIAIDVIIRKYNLPTSYPEKVIKEVEAIPEEIPEEEIKRRRDLREQLCFTIDPEKAGDFDDAVAIELTPEGYYKLYVHIADVSYYVREGTETDKEAYKRGFTYYFPDRALHMLPEKLSAKLCSLRPNEDKLAFTVEMVFDESGNLKAYDIYESVIRSKARLTYNEALALIVGDPALEKKFPNLVEPLRMMETLYRILSRKRWEMGSIDFDLPEAEVIVDEYGEPTAIYPYERHVAHRIIEHFMISANETVALHLEHAGYPCLYRVHEPPDEEKVENLLEILEGLGYKVKRPHEYTPKFFQKIIEDFEGRPEENLVRFLTLRAMARAKYSPHNVGHFGLALEHYAHFTSPIRRYPDIIVHRLLKKALRGEEIDYEKTLAYLEEAGNHLSKQERIADEAEMEAIDYLKARYMKGRIGEEFIGIITGVVAFGFFVELEENLVEGLVKINTLTDDEYVFDEPAHRLVGVRTGKVFRLGDHVKVRCIAVDEERARVEFELIEKLEKHETL